MRMPAAVTSSPCARATSGPGTIRQLRLRAMTRETSFFQCRGPLLVVARAKRSLLDRMSLPSQSPLAPSIEQAKKENRKKHAHIKQSDQAHFFLVHNGPRVHEGHLHVESQEQQCVTVVPRVIAPPYRIRDSTPALAGTSLPGSGRVGPIKRASPYTPKTVPAMPTARASSRLYCSRTPISYPPGRATMRLLACR